MLAIIYWPSRIYHVLSITLNFIVNPGAGLDGREVSCDYHAHDALDSIFAVFTLSIRCYATKRQLPAVRASFRS